MKLRKTIMAAVAAAMLTVGAAGASLRRQTEGDLFHSW